MWVHIYVHTYGDQRLSSGIFLHDSIPDILRQGLSFELRAHQGWLSKSASLFQGFPVSVSFTLWLQRAANPLSGSLSAGDLNSGPYTFLALAKQAPRPLAIFLGVASCNRNPASLFSMSSVSYVERWSNMGKHQWRWSHADYILFHLDWITSEHPIHCQKNISSKKCKTLEESILSFHLLMNKCCKLRGSQRHDNKHSSLTCL